MRFLLDTNILSEPTKPDPAPSLLEKMNLHRREACTGAPVWQELLFGVRRLPSSKRRRHLENYLQRVVLASMRILPYGTAAADWHAEERARLARIGKTPSFVDGQIAAIARVHDLVLVTRNVSDFTVFSDLQVENWIESV